MSFTTSILANRVIAGRRHVLVEVVETGAGPTDEWSVEVPPFLELRLVHTALTTPGSAATVQPELGLEAAWSPGLEAVVASATPAAVVRVQDAVVVAAPNGRVFGRSRPDAASGEIRTRLAWVEGLA